MAFSPEIIIPNVRLGIEDLLAVIQGLDATSRTRVAKALVNAEMDARFSGLIEQMAARVPDDITDAEIDQEVQAVRASARRA